MQAPTAAAVGREQEVKSSGSPGSENTNEEEEISFAAKSLLMLQQARNNLVSSRQTRSKFPEDQLDIELFIYLVYQFLGIWHARLNGFNDHNKKKVTWIEAVIQRCSVKVFLESSQNSQENPCARVSFLMKLQS